MTFRSWFDGSYIRYVASNTPGVYKFEKIPSDQIIKTTINGQGDAQYATRQFLLSPVVEATREHFKCKDITGVTLE